MSGVLAEKVLQGVGSNHFAPDLSLRVFVAKSAAQGARQKMQLMFRVLHKPPPHEARLRLIQKVSNDCIVFSQLFPEEGT